MSSLLHCLLFSFKATSFHTISPFHKEEIPLWATEGAHRIPQRTHIFLSALPASVSLLVFVVLSRRFSHAQHVRVAQGTNFSLWSTCLARIPTKHSLSTHHVSPWCSDSVYFLFDSATIPDTFSTDADWNQIKPSCTPPRGWTVWPSGHTTSHHMPSESFVKNQIACLARIVLRERRLGRKPRSMWSRIHYLLFSFTFFFCDVFSEISAFTQYFHFYCQFSVWRNALFFLNKLKNTTSPFGCQKKLSVCALCCWGLCFVVRNLLLNFHQNKLLYSILQQKSFHVHCCFVVSKKKTLCLSLETLFSSCFSSSFFSSFIVSCPFCGRSDTDIGRGSSVAWSRLISFLCHFISLFPRFSLLRLFYDNVFFVVSFWCPSLFLFFSLVFSSFCHFLVFPTFLSSLFLNKNLFLFYLFFFDLLLFWLFFF